VFTTYPTNYNLTYIHDHACTSPYFGNITLANLAKECDTRCQWILSESGPGWSSYWPIRV